MSEERDEILEQLLVQLPDESPTAYSAFLAFFQLNLTERFGKEGLENVAQRTGLSVGMVKQHRANHNWFARINLIDKHFAQLQFKERVKVNQEHNLKCANDLRNLQSKLMKIADVGASVALDVLSKVNLGTKVTETDYVKVLQPDGTHKVMPITTKMNFDPNFRVSDIAQLLGVVANIPGKMATLPIETVPLPSQTTDASLQDKPIEELVERQAELQKEKAKITNIDQLQ